MEQKLALGLNLSLALNIQNLVQKVQKLAQNGHNLAQIVKNLRSKYKKNMAKSLALLC